jgi:hypothetical protein
MSAPANVDHEEAYAKLADALCRLAAAAWRARQQAEASGDQDPGSTATAEQVVVCAQ